jgi:NAD(P)-dependent dehydrogenase (short-subunit alcohol dehydrogenase family)
MNLTDQNVIVIGGTSGIGAAIAQAATAAGAHVTAIGREIADATDEAAMQRVLEAPVHHVVITAVNASYQNIHEMDLAAARRSIDSKIGSALIAAKHTRFLPGGSLTLTAGIAMDRPGPSASIVATMNGAITAMTRALAIELAPVRVNVLSPGWIDTPVWTALAGDKKAEIHAAHAKKLPVGRIGAPADVAAAALFLMTNGFMTGECLHIDGGHRLI